MKNKKNKKTRAPRLAAPCGRLSAIGVPFGSHSKKQAYVGVCILRPFLTVPMLISYR